jgi:DNA-binding MarR family transcriptional regulator
MTSRPGVRAGATVADVMVRHPKTVPWTASVSDATSAFDDDHVHMLLLVDEADPVVLRGTLLRGDLPSVRARADAPAAPYATLDGRTIRASAPAESARLDLLASSRRRLAVTDDARALLGLLCLKADGTGFCTDAGIGARADGATDDLADALITASRALVGVSLRSVAAAPVEVTLPQHRALVLIASGAATTISALAEPLGVNQSNASRIVARLERLRLVARERSARDGRAVTVGLTSAGREILEAVTGRRRAEIVEIVSTMSDEDRITAVGAVRAFNTAAREAADDAWPRA